MRRLFQTVSLLLILGFFAPLAAEDKPLIILDIQETVKRPADGVDVAKDVHEFKEIDGPNYHTYYLGSYLKRAGYEVKTVRKAKWMSKDQVEMPKADSGDDWDKAVLDKAKELGAAFILSGRSKVRFVQSSVFRGVPANFEYAGETTLSLEDGEGKELTSFEIEDVYGTGQRNEKKGKIGLHPDALTNKRALEESFDASEQNIFTRLAKFTAVDLLQSEPISEHISEEDMSWLQKNLIAPIEAHRNE